MSVIPCVEPQTGPSGCHDPPVSPAPPQPYVATYPLPLTKPPLNGSERIPDFCPTFIRLQQGMMDLVWDFSGFSL